MTTENEIPLVKLDLAVCVHVHRLEALVHNVIVQREVRRAQSSTKLVGVKDVVLVKIELTESQGEEGKLFAPPLVSLRTALNEHRRICVPELLVQAMFQNMPKIQ